MLGSPERRARFVGRQHRARPSQDSEDGGGDRWALLPRRRWPSRALSADGMCGLETVPDDSRRFQTRPDGWGPVMRGSAARGRVWGCATGGRAPAHRDPAGRRARPVCACARVCVRARAGPPSSGGRGVGDADDGHGGVGEADEVLDAQDAADADGEEDAEEHVEAEVEHLHVPEPVPVVLVAHLRARSPSLSLPLPFPPSLPLSLGRDTVARMRGRGVLGPGNRRSALGLWKESGTMATFFYFTTFFPTFP